MFTGLILWLLIFLVVAVSFPLEVSGLLLLAPLLMFQKFRHIIFILLTLEFVSLSVIAFATHSYALGGLSMEGLLAIITFLIMEATVGLGLMVAVIRWQGKGCATLA